MNEVKYEIQNAGESSGNSVGLCGRIRIALGNFRTAGNLLDLLTSPKQGYLDSRLGHHFFQDDRLAIAALLAVVTGHIWPVQLRFRGGTGVATSIGALLVYDWRLIVVYVAVFACGWLLARKTVLPGLFAFVCLPAAAFWLHHDGIELATLTCLTGMIGFAHRTNLADEIPALAARRGTTHKPEHTDP